MQYLGGKSKIRKQIAQYLESVREPGQMYFEPFVGGGWVLQEVADPRIASDGFAPLITMYQALQGGWIPPDLVSEQTYRHVWYLNNPDSPLTAFCGIGCSFGGKLWGGYARSAVRNYALESKRNVLKQLPKIKTVEFVKGLFQDHQPDGMLVYCDPPYYGTTPFKGMGPFDHELFWSTMREWSKNNTVVVSEYQAPDDFECVAEFTSQMGFTSKGVRAKRVERLFRLI